VVRAVETGGAPPARMSIADPAAERRPGRAQPAELGAHTVGLVVDGVSEVLRVSGEQIEPPSTLVTTADSTFLRGVARIDERLILLLDLAQILSGSEQDTLAA
jgi:purine-binding chemotaxis protein CheW